MSRIRHWMAIETRKAQSNGQTGFTRIQTEHINLLARLMDRAYQGTIDHEGESLEQCEQEMQDVISGKYGRLIEEASNLILVGNEAVAACLVTMWKEKPLIAFSMADPGQQRKGFSKALIEKAMESLRSLQEPVLYLVVTDGNLPAQNLYYKVGFKQLGPAVAGESPPVI